MKPPTSPRFRRGLVAAVTLGAAVRLTVLATKWGDPLLLNDSLWYSAQATQLIRGQGFAHAFSPHPTAEHGPLVPILLAPVSWGHEQFGWQRLVMTMIGIGTVALVGLVASELAGRRAGVIAAFLAAVAPNLWVSDGVIMSETPTIFLMCLAMWCLLRARRSANAMRWLAATGLSIGLATLARSEMVLFAPMFAWIAWSTVPVAAGEPGKEVAPSRPSRPAWMAAGWTHAVIVLGVALLTISPWVVRNLIVFEEPVVLTTNEGATFLGANCPDTYFGDKIGGWSLVCVLEGGSPPDEEGSLRSARYRSLATSYARDHIGQMPAVVAARLGRVLDVYKIDQQVAGDVGEDRDELVVWAGIVAWWLLAAGALVGARRVKPGDRLLMATPVIIAVAVAVVFYGSRRLRAPVEPVVIILSALTIEHWWRNRTTDLQQGDAEDQSGAQLPMGVS